jgi:hypothetical protein
MGLGADVNIVGGILAGVAFTRLASGFVPASLATGIPGYITTALIAMLPRFISKKPFTKYMSWGGLAVLGGKIINDYAPSFAGYIPGFNGLGFVAANGGFFTPQLPQFGSMGRFVAPGTVSAAIAAAAGKGGIHGLQIAPSTRGSIGDGNFGARRGGRLN